MAELIDVDRSDLLKIRDALDACAAHHSKRDESNAAIHMAREVRYSPLTTTIAAALQRINELIVRSSHG